MLSTPLRRRVPLLTGRPEGRSLGAEMDPTAFYAALVIVALVILAVAMLLSPSAKRRCPSCERDVALGARACRCGYAFS